MLLSNLKRSTHHVHKDSYLLVPNSDYSIESTHVRPNAIVLAAGVSRTKKVSPLITHFSSCLVPHCPTDLHARIGTVEIFHLLASCLKDDSHLLTGQSSAQDTLGENNSILPKSSNRENGREMERRRKIGIANKGKIPWNKGRTHGDETREIISRRTKEAMRNPKVRTKMSECRRPLSTQTKSRISMSLRKLWGQRLKWKRSREKIFHLWAESISRAAKTGDSDQQELEWDSFKKIKREMHLQQLEQDAQRAKEKEMTRIRTERASKEREERKKRLAKKEKKEQKEKAKVGGESKRKTRKRCKEDTEELTGNQEFILQRKLMKIRKQKSIISRVSNQHQRSWENLDMKFKRTEQNQVTLADQIHLAKVRRAESLTRETLTI